MNSGAIINPLAKAFYLVHGNITTRCENNSKMFRHISLINCDKTFVVLKKAEKPLAPLVLAGENLEIVMFESKIFFCKTSIFIMKQSTAKNRNDT